MDKIDSIILEISLKKISEAFDRFIGECTDEYGKPSQPDIRALMKAKGYLPSYCNHSYKKDQHG